MAANQGVEEIPDKRIGSAKRLALRRAWLGVGKKFALSVTGCGFLQPYVIMNVCSLGSVPASRHARFARRTYALR